MLQDTFKVYSTLNKDSKSAVQRAGVQPPRARSQKRQQKRHDLAREAVGLQRRVGRQRRLGLGSFTGRSWYSPCLAVLVIQRFGSLLAPASCEFSHVAVARGVRPSQSAPRPLRVGATRQSAHCLSTSCAARSRSEPTWFHRQYPE
jgi:hypothetical protein